MKRLSMLAYAYLLASVQNRVSLCMPFVYLFNLSWQTEDLG